LLATNCPKTISKSTINLRHPDMIAAPQLSSRSRSCPVKHPPNSQTTYLIILAQHRPPLAVPRQRPANAAVTQLRRADLAREGPVRPIEHVLGRDLDLPPEVLARQQQVERGGGDDDLYARNGVRGEKGGS
jgi:hypothetical protein